MRLRTREEGWTLIELLVSMTLMIIVLSATLNALDVFGQSTKRDTTVNDQQEIARRSMDRVAGQLRNLASPSNGLTTINYADDTKVIFQTTDPNKQWVAYCLQTSPVGGINASTSNAILWYQTYTNAGVAVSTPPNQNCPDTTNSWTTKQQVAANITNFNNASRPVFTYGSYTQEGLSTPVAAANLSSIVRVWIKLFIDADVTRTPAETELSSEAFLRNQNQPPQAGFMAYPSGNTYQLDGGSSTDPEGRTLKYDWYEIKTLPATDPSSATVSSLPDCSTNPVGSPVNGFTCLGSGAVLVHDFTGDPLRQADKSVNVFLRVTDPGGLSSLTVMSAAACPSNANSTRLPTQCDNLATS